jgi:hypothetical protein
MPPFSKLTLLLCQDLLPSFTTYLVRLLLLITTQRLVCQVTVYSYGTRQHNRRSRQWIQSTLWI